MGLNPIGIAVPFFLFLIGVEYLVLRGRGERVRVNDTVTDISCGLGDQSLGIFIKLLTLIPYAYLLSNHKLIELDSGSWVSWSFAFVAVDFAYYWYHRFSHRVNIGWATHVVHHQSEEYNLSVALRQSWFSGLFSWVFYLPLAVLGVPLEMYLSCYAFNLLYQFWIHTETIDRMGPFEWFFNTPSHHRVHHGTNPAYVDKNYAGVFIIWDRLFGTFQVEDERPLYGTLKPVRSWNAAWANVEPWVALGRQSTAQTSLWRAFQVWWSPPGWSEGTEVAPATLFDGPDRGYDEDKAEGRHAYIFINMVIMGFILGVLLTFQSQISYTIHGFACGLIVVSVMVWGGLFEGKGWAWPVEALRLCLLALFAFVAYSNL